MLYVPKGTKSLYENANGWNSFTISEIPDISLTLTKGMVTYANELKLDFTTPISGLKAYVVAEVTGSKAVLTEVSSAVPAATGLILKGIAGQTYDIPYVIGDVSPMTNKLVGVTTDTAIGGNGTDYILKDGKFVKANAGTLSGGKAYLKLDNAEVREVVFIDTETTGINTTLMNSEKVKSEVYNLNGQRISSPKQGGLYIVNGKKTIIK